MRFFSLFVLLAYGAFQVFSATCEPKLTNGLVAQDDLQTCSNPPGPEITFLEGASHSAHDRFNALGIQGDERQIVENYHKAVVAEYMKGIPGAHSAVIKSPAHSIGSNDPYIHIGATIKREDGTIIRLRPPPEFKAKDRLRTHHIYTNMKNPSDGYTVLPIEYREAIDREGLHPGKA